MLQISSDKLSYFEQEVKNINRKLSYKFMLDGKELELSNVMNNPTITYDNGLDQYSVGNLYIKELSFSVKNTVFVNYKSEIVITVEMQTSGGTISTQLGKFYVDTVVEQGATKQIKAYDGMFLLNVGYFPSAKHTTTKAIVDDIASKHKLTVVGWNNRSASINNEQIDGKTVLEMLQLVAGVHGGSFFMDGNGAVKFVQATDTGLTYNKSEYNTPTLDTTVSYNITKLRVVYGEKTTGEDGAVTDEGYYEVGEGVDARTLAISNPLLKGQRTQAQNVLNSIKAMNGYKRFDTTILLGDYRLEPMDVVTYIKDNTTYKVPIIYMQVVLTYGGISVRTQSPVLAESKSEFSFKGTLTQKVDNIYSDMVQVKSIVADTITTTDLEAVNAEIENLKAKDATITNLVASKADIKDLNATNATIQNLQATDAQIQNLVATKADITSLYATNAEIDKLQADVADIDRLLAGNITGGNIQAGSISSDKLIIDDGFIKDAMIDTVSANKILSGRIDTGAVIISSDDSKMYIADGTIQISDGTYVRVQIGETANGDYAIVIWDEYGNVMFDATGITEHAIKDAIIKDDMVSNTANINAQKINISSLFSVINNDGTNTLNASKIFLDTQEQTLNIAFNQMVTRQNEAEEETDTLITELNVEKGKISTLIQQATVLEQEQTVLNGKITSVTQDIDGVTTKVESMESTFTEDLEVIEQRLSSAELKITEDAIVSTVTNSTVFKDSIGGVIAESDMTMGGRNLLKQTRNFSEVVQSSSPWTIQDSQDSDPLTLNTGGGDASFKELYASVGDDYNPHMVAIPLYSHFKSLKTDLTLTLEYRGWDDLVAVGLGDGHVSTLKYDYSDSPYDGIGDGEATGICMIPDKYENVNLSDFKVIGQDGAWTRISYTFSASYVEEINNYIDGCNKNPGHADNDSTPPEEPNYYLVFLIRRREGYYADFRCGIRKPKLEIGGLATDWTPAPNDIEEDVAEEFEITYTKIEQNAENITLTASRTDSNEQAISSLQVNADSINASVQEVTTTIDAITGELNTLTNKVEASMSSEDIKFLISSEVANSSVGKVTTETGFTFDKNGLTINKSDSEMSTLVDEDGLTIYKNNDVMLDVNNQGVDAQNVSVKTYLIIGTNSRMENYQGNRTAIFFIGDTEV